MDQSITINLAGRELHLKASSPDMERLMRLAADDINAKLESYTVRYMDRSFEDKLAVVALQETVNRLVAQKRLNAASSEADALKGELDAYLAGIDDK